MMSDMAKSPVICVHEDRANCLTGAKLSILSLRERCPDFPIVVSCPASFTSFIEWLRPLPKVEAVSFEEAKDRGWNVKPIILLRLLEEGYSDVLWVDADIIATRDVLTPLTRLSRETFVATEEHFWGQMHGGTVRTTAWGLEVGREMPRTINSGVLRVTSAHVGLLEAWLQMMNHPLYVEAQAIPWYERPLHMVSDQDVLTGLLGSREFSDVPMVLLKRGVDIAQCMGAAGFTPWERIRALGSGLPGLVHSQGIKTWLKQPDPPRLEFKSSFLRRYYDYLHMELTPYVPVARPYGPALGEDVQWMELASVPARIMAGLTGNSSILQEFPLSLIDAVSRALRKWLKIARFPVHDRFRLHESPLLPIHG